MSENRVIWPIQLCSTPFLCPAQHAGSVVIPVAIRIVGILVAIWIVMIPGAIWVVVIGIVAVVAAVTIVMMAVAEVETKTILMVSAPSLRGRGPGEHA